MSYDFLGTITRPMWERFKSFAQNQADENPERAQHLKAEIARTKHLVKRVEYADNALRNMNVTPESNIQGTAFDLQDIDGQPMVEGAPRGDYGWIQKTTKKVPQVTRGSLGDSEAGMVSTKIKDSMIDVIKWKREGLEYRYKKLMDSAEMLEKEMKLLERRGSEIPELISKMEELFSDEVNHRRHLFEGKHPFTSRGTLLHEEVVGTRTPDEKFQQPVGVDQPNNPVKVS